MVEDKIQRNLELIDKSKSIIKEAFKQAKPEEIAVTWTGGKDSTTNLWLVRQVCLEENYDMPHIVTIDEGDAFPEITDFLVNISKKWYIDLKWLCNFDVLAACLSHLGNTVQVKRLNERNREELKRIDFTEDSFIFEAESYAGNHLMKTVVLNQFIEDNNIKMVFTAVRRDEQQARRKDNYFTHKDGGYLMPEHTRATPILDFTERDIWDNTQIHNLPYCSLYKIGYRSLGARTTSNVGEAGVPAWEQDLDNTTERAGRRQDKEKAMERLRKLGYM